MPETTPETSPKQYQKSHPFWRWYTLQKVVICSLNNNTKIAPRIALHLESHLMVYGVMYRWRGVDKKQLAGRLQGYCGRPASSLGMAGTGGGSLVGSPSIRYNRTRRSSMSYYEENNRQSSQYNLQVGVN